MLLVAIIGGATRPVYAAEEMTYEKYEADYYINYSSYEYYMSEAFTLHIWHKWRKQRECRI